MKFRKVHGDDFVVTSIVNEALLFVVTFNNSFFLSFSELKLQIEIVLVVIGLKFSLLRCISCENLEATVGE